VTTGATRLGVRRGFLAVPGGTIHYAEAGAGAPFLLLHQTPRSWDEYRDVLPLLGHAVRAIAMDTLGFGDSVNETGEDSIERYAEAAGDFLDALGVERASIVGHHTGGVIALELAARRPELVERLALSSTPWVDDAFRQERAAGPGVDRVPTSEDGEHLVGLWRFRQAFYPPGRIDLLERFVVDALRAGPRREEGHRAVYRYRMGERIGLVRAPVLLIRASDDRFAYEHVTRLAGRLPGSRIVDIEGGMVPLPDGLPDRFAEAVLQSLELPAATAPGPSSRPRSRAAP